MTEDSGRPTPEYKTGDVANGHVLTAAGWMLVRPLTSGSPEPYYAGDLLDGKVFTGTDWVVVPVAESATPLRPPVSKTRSQGRKKTRSRRRKKIALAAGISAVAALAVLGTVVLANDRMPQFLRYGPTADLSEPDREYVAGLEKEGWFHLSGHLYGKWDEAKPEDLGSILTLQVASPDGCPNGVEVRVDIKDRSKTVVDSPEAELDSLPAKKQAGMEFLTGQAGKFDFRASESACY